MTGWQLEPGTLMVRFDELVGDAGANVQAGVAEAIAAHLGVQGVDPATALRSCIGSPTLTYSGGRTHVNEFWSDEVEQLFQELGGGEINRLLGYR